MNSLIEDIRQAVTDLAQTYSISKATLFGSQADGTATAESDIDLIIEFYAPVTLFTIARLTEELKDLLHKEVDVIHGPLRESDLIEPSKEIEVYAA